jgi:electron transport complex protein RnfE
MNSTARPLPLLSPMQPPNNDLAAAGLWRNNLALVQLLALCPLLAVTTSVVNGLALGLATTGVLVVTNTVVSLLRRALIPSLRIPLSLLVIASLVTCVDLLTHAVLDDLHEVLGLFIPLIVTNCGVLAQAQTVASRRPVLESLLSGLATGVGFLGVLVTLGALREVLGHGTLLAGMPLLAGEWSAGLRIDLPFDGMLVAVLPPGAFFGMALLLALRNRLTRAHEVRTAPAPAGETPR